MRSGELTFHGVERVTTGKPKERVTESGQPYRVQYVTLHFADGGEFVVACFLVEDSK